MISNRQVSTLLHQMSAVSQVIDKDKFRSQAYQNASAAIDNLTVDVQTLWQNDKLDEIPGVGDSIKRYLDELFSTGKVKHFQSEFKKVPKGMFALMTVRGIGPKTAYKISKKFNLNRSQTALSSLKKLIKNNKIKKTSGFGEKSQAKIKTAIESKFSGKQRLPLSEAIDIADRYLAYLNKTPLISKAEVLGSLRRHNATVGDIDIAFATINPKEAMAYALEYPEINKVVTSGEVLSHFQLKSGREMDVKSVDPSQWGSLLQHYTGSKLHNINLRTYAQGKKLSLSEYGVKNAGGNVKKFGDEQSFYHHLGLQYIPPELREGEEEVDLSKKNKIPKLIDVSDIKGDLHLHSDFEFSSSHDLGQSKLSEFIDFAISHNYQYLGFTDHNPQKDLSYKQKLKIITDRRNYLVQSYNNYENSVKKKMPHLLIGLEIDIRPNGDLALEDELIDLLDYAIVSVHSSFDQDPDKNTNRLLKALSHPKCLILGHPTGRKINFRPPLQAHWQEIIDHCAKNHKVLEINSSPDRLDLPDDLVKQAVKSNAKLIINTDAHESNQLSLIKYGVWVARRGWCQPENIINTLSLSDLKRVLNLS